MNTINNDIAKIIGEINEVAIKINIQNLNHVSTDLMGGVNSFTIMVFEYGWALGKENPNFMERIYYDEKYSLKKLKRILDTLRKLYKNGRLNYDKFDYKTETVKVFKFGKSKLRIRFKFWK